jgi:hypothetical protein
MGQYTDFIKQIIKSDFGGANVLQYSDIGAEIYISFQTLLRFTSEYINLVGPNDEPVVKIDWESEKPFFAYSTSVSCNLSKCYLYNDYVKVGAGSFEQEGIGLFKPFTEFEDANIKKLQQSLATAATASLDTQYSTYPTIGNINYIYLNIGYLSDLIFEGSNNAENKTSIRNYLQGVCDSVGKALGSINDFQVIIDDDENALTIIDFNQKRIKNLNATENQKITRIKAQGLGTFITGISAQSSITPDIAATISIGAQANGNQLGEEATTFSRLSRGLIDRFYTEKQIKNSDKPNDIDLKNKNNTVFQETTKAYIEIISNQKELDNKISYKSTDKINLENIPVELYKALLGKFTEENITSTTFIPVKIDFTLAGISGIKIFQRFDISSDVLPYAYSNNFDLMVLGVSHEITTNGQWVTKLSTITVLKEN